PGKVQLHAWKIAAGRRTPPRFLAGGGFASRWKGNIMAGEKFIYGNNPYIPINYFQNMADPNQQGRDWLTRYAKGGLKNLSMGKDVSNFGELNSIAQTAAMQRQQAQEGQGMGAAALMSAQGGEQEALQRSITSKAVNQINAQQGMADVNALANLQNQWSGEFQGGL